MAYTPTTWADGDIITAEKMNKLEQGVADGQGVQSEAVQTIAVLTQTQYDALSTKDAATLYIIKE